MAVRQVMLGLGILMMSPLAVADDPPSIPASTISATQSFTTHCVALSTRYMRRADAAICEGMAARSHIVQGDAVRFLLQSTPDVRAQFIQAQFKERFNMVEQGQDMSKLAWFLMYEQSHNTEISDTAVLRLAKDIMYPSFGSEQLGHMVATFVPSAAATDANAMLLGGTPGACLTAVPWRDVAIPADVPEKGKVRAKDRVKIIPCTEADPNAVTAAACLPEPQAVVDSCVKILS